MPARLASGVPGTIGCRAGNVAELTSYLLENPARPVLSGQALSAGRVGCARGAGGPCPRGGGLCPRGGRALSAGRAGQKMDRAPSVETGSEARPPFDDSGLALPMRLEVTA
jgi:hypothetical protein